MIPGVNFISGKASVVSVNGIGGSGVVLSPSVGVLGAEPSKKMFSL